MLELMNREDETVARAVESQIPQIAQAVDRVTQALQAGGRLFYIGAGTSGRLGVLDAAECPPTFGVSPELVQGVIAGGEGALARATEASEDNAETGRVDLLQRGFRAGDVLAGIAASGRTPYVLGAVGTARAMGALTIGISCTPQSELSQMVEIAIEPLTGPEVIAGSTRLKAGTATKLVLNMLSTGVMIRLGFVYGNLMVNVQAKNVKLEDRAKRIIADGRSPVCRPDGGIAAGIRGQRENRDRDGQVRVGQGRRRGAACGCGGRVAEALNRPDDSL